MRVAVLRFLVRRHVVARHEDGVRPVCRFGPLGDHDRIAAHPPEQFVHIPPLGVEQRPQLVPKLSGGSEILFVALLVRGARGDLVEYDFAAGVGLVDVVAIGNQHRFHLEHAFLAELVEYRRIFSSRCTSIRSALNSVGSIW